MRKPVAFDAEAERIAGGHISVRVSLSDVVVFRHIARPDAGPDALSDACDEAVNRLACRLADLVREDW